MEQIRKSIQSELQSLSQKNQAADEKWQQRLEEVERLMQVQKQVELEKMKKDLQKEFESEKQTFQKRIDLEKQKSDEKHKFEIEKLIEKFSQEMAAMQRPKQPPKPS